jgi:hypothetical protein
MIIVSGLLCAMGLGGETDGEAVLPICPMVTERQNTGLFQLIEVTDSQGNKGVGAPGEMVLVKCTIVNMTKRDLLVAEERIAPLSIPIEAFTDDIDDFVAGYPEDQRPMIKMAVEGLGGRLILSDRIDLPGAGIINGFDRHWVRMAGGHDAWCGCGIHNREYSKTIEVPMPKENWTSVVLTLNQFIPAILLGPEEHVYLDSDLKITIDRRKANKPAQTDGDKPSK